MAKKIGFIDYYLDEWHANNYPAWIEKASGGAYTVAYAYGEIDSPLGGKTTAQWCDAMHVERCESIDALIEKSDCIIVLSPDNPEQHWALCQKPLRSGKRVYVDKTFAPTAQIARDLFALAEENGTPMYSSSALRFSKELAELPEKDVRFVLLSGPGKPENYLIHQIEPMVALLRARPVRVLYAGVEGAASYTVEFADGGEIRRRRGRADRGIDRDLRPADRRHGALLRDRRGAGGRAGDGRDRGDPRGRAQGGGRAGRVGGRRIRRSCVVVRS